MLSKLLEPRGRRGKCELTAYGLSLKQGGDHFGRTYINEGGLGPSLGAPSTLKGQEEADQARYGGDRRVPCHRGQGRTPRGGASKSPCPRDIGEGGRVPGSAGHEIAGDVSKT